jgi:CMP-N,N'-diacetyllegionaminic acid synthase
MILGALRIWRWLTAGGANEHINHTLGLAHSWRGSGYLFGLYFGWAWRKVLGLTALGLILARGGSKRCVGKNIRDLGGRPLLAWSIAAGFMSFAIDAVVVSSDSEEIINVGAMFGAACIMRPPELCTDDASSYPSILHAIEEFEGTFDWVCLLQPTSPFRTHGDVNAGWLAMSHNLPDARPASVSHEVGKSVPNGAVYWAHVGWLVEQLAAGVEAPFDGVVPVQYSMPADRSIDIDTEHDFSVAEGMLRRAGTA